MFRTLTLVTLLSLSTVASAQSDALSFVLGPITRIGQSDIVHSFGTLHNQIGADIQNVTVQVDLLGPRTMYVGGQDDAHWSCKNGPTPFQLFCTTPLIHSGESLDLQIYAGPGFEARLQLSAQASWQYFEGTFYTPVSRQAGKFARELVVTNTGDLGAGSLRSAIESANDACTRDQVPCDIVFHIDSPLPERGWYTIYPNTPLPAITAPDVRIEGATQTQFGGDSNPLGPEIALDGAALGIGNGLQIAGEGTAVEVRDLAIGGFPWNGIAVTRRSYSTSKIERNYIGVDPTGTHAHPNGSRGIAFERPAQEFDVTGNIISGNVRSGVFIAGGVVIKLAANTIGAGSNGLPLPNGASGVFLGDEAGEIELLRNTIAHNTQFGVAIAQRAARYSLIENSIFANGFIGIDRGLNGFDGYENNDQDLQNAKIPPPRLTSATYDPATDLTTITGTYYPERDHWGQWELTLFVSERNDGQGETVLGSTSTQTGALTVKYPGDLRGRFITATGQRTLYLGFSGTWSWTTEFSEAVEVR